MRSALFYPSIRQPLGFLGVLCLIWLSVMLLPTAVLAQSEEGSRSSVVTNPANDLWRGIRQRDAELTGTTQVKGMDSGTLINPYAERWRAFRMGQLLPFAGYLLAGVLLLVALFYLVRGRITVEGGDSGQRLHRYNLYERTIHWFMAVVFLALALTGLILLFGRSLLLPWMGPELFSSLATFSKESHDLLGPLFLLALLLMFLQFVGRNIYQKGDMTWLLRGGGIIGKKHAPSNFFNMGEKSMFWMLVLVGGLIAGSGLMLLFPIFDQGRVWLSLSHVAHGIAAVVMLAAVIGHIYIGTIGMEGALDGMTTGYCELNWAREHHDQWARACEERGEVISADEVAEQKHASSVKNKGNAAPGVG